jgi:hypothetical protein
MDDRTSQHLDMIGQVNTVFTDPAYTTALGTGIALKARIGTFQAHLPTIAGILQQLGLSRKGITLDKQTTTEKLVEATVINAQLGASYAYDRQNATLEKKLHVVESSLDRLHDTLIDDQCEGLRTELQALVTADAGLALDADPMPIQAYGVTQATLDELEALIIAYGAIVSSPQAAKRADKLTLASLIKEVAATRELLDRSLDRLMLLLKNDPSGVYAAYTEARKIIGNNGGGADDNAGDTATPPTK